MNDVDWFCTQKIFYYSYQPGSQNFLSLNYHVYCYNYKSTVYITFNFRNTRMYGPRCSSTSYIVCPFKTFFCSSVTDESFLFDETRENSEFQSWLLWWVKLNKSNIDWRTVHTWTLMVMFMRGQICHIIVLPWSFKMLRWSTTETHKKFAYISQSISIFWYGNAFYFIKLIKNWNCVWHITSHYICTEAY